MAISSNKEQKEQDSLIESTSTPGQPAQAVCNPDGSDIGAGGGSTQYAEDTAHVTGDLGNPMLTVREDTLGASTAGAVGDYAAMKSDNNGAAYVNDKTSGTQNTNTADIFASVTASEAKDFDGAALPNAAGAEGRLVKNAASLYGVQYVMPVSEDGSEIATIKVNPITGQTGVAAGVGAVGATTQRITEGSTTMQAMGTDAIGADTYATVQTPSANATKIVALNTGTNGAIISLDAGNTDNFPLPGGAYVVLEAVTITAAVAIQAKNLVGGSNYTGVYISCW